MTDRPTTQQALDARFGDAPAAPPETDQLADMAGRGVCRLYRPDPIDPDLLRTLCGVALSAPSKSDLQQRDIVIVHHTHCGATSFTRDGIIDAYAKEHGADIETLYPAESICISDYTESLAHDVGLMRQSAGTPQNANIYGYMYDIDAEKLIKVTESLAG